MRFILGIDTGGTFTDFIFLSNGEVLIHKVLSTPDNPSRAILEGLRAMVKGSETVMEPLSRPMPFLGQRKIYFDMLRRPTYERERLHPGDRIRGPAVIYEFSSIVVVPPVWRARVDRCSNLDLLRN